jgi:hypothetical protein
MSMRRSIRGRRIIGCAVMSRMNCPRWCCAISRAPTCRGRRLPAIRWAATAR